MIKRILFFFFISAFIAGCGGTNSIAAKPPACSVVMSGAVSKTLSCTVVMGYDSSKNQSDFAVVVPPLADNVGEVTINLGFPGELHTGSYSLATSPQGVAYAYESAKQVWAAQSQPLTGSGTLTLTSVTAAAMSNQGKVYSGDGSADFILPDAYNTGNPPLTVHVSFQIPGASSTPDVAATLKALPNPSGTLPKLTPVKLVTPVTASTLPALPTGTSVAGGGTGASGTPAASPAPTNVNGTPTSIAAQDAGQPCQFTLSEAVSKTVDCTVHMVYSAKDGTTGFEIISKNRVTSLPEVSLIIQIKGEPRPAPVTYGWDNSLQQAASVYEGGTQAYAAASKAKRGSSEVTFTSITVTNTADDGGKVYAPHGSAIAALLGPSGTVKIEVTY